MKLKRLLTAALSAVMALSVCAMPAMAAGTTSKSTFDPSITEGTLTITKYEQTEDDKTKDNDEEKKGKLLDGVEFTVYKLANIKQENGKLVYEPVEQLKDVLSDTDFDNITDDPADLYNTISTKLANVTMTTLDHESETTGTDSTLGSGKVQFKLKLGIYMVAETKAPSQILTKSANFIVSIPMMSDDKQTWNYDVVAEPKNTPTYGGVTLIKTGRVAGDTGNGNPLSNVLFRLDIDDNGTWNPVDLSNVEFDKGASAQTTSESGEIENKGYITTGDNGYINIKSGLAPAKYRFVELEAVNGYIADTTKNYAFEVYNDAGTLKVKVGEERDVKSIDVINERPDFEKNIDKRDGTTSTNHDADYSIGDKVPYTLTVKVPDTIGDLKVFSVTDTVQAKELYYNKDFALTYVDDDGNTQILNTECYEITYVNDSKDTTSDTCSFTINFKPAGEGKGLTADFKDKTITIKYTAELLAGAKITNEGNINSAKLSYSNKTSTDANGKPNTDDGKPYEIHDEGVVYTFQTGIKKVDEKGQPLSGVRFDLYKKVDKNDAKVTDSNGTVTGITFNGTTLSLVDDTTVKALGLDVDAQWVKVTSLTSAETTGKADVKGLAKGTYMLVETETKEGYNLLKEPVTAELEVDYKASWKTDDKYDANGVLIKHEYKKDETTFDNNKASTVITVVNRKGFNLPRTGGFGTLLFSGIGVLLVLAGVSVLFSLKKKNNRA